MRQSDADTGVRIDWSYPEPKNAFDRFVGPGATRAEQVLQFAAPAVAAAVLVLAALVGGSGWSLVQYIVAAVITLDMVGGVITNATGAAKRWHHRRSQGFGNHMGFVLIHIVQIAVVMCSLAN
jgi:VIT1/CCC1 family predicted Fe2+/Mn2+ transporter